ncbi:SusC/RagA family TonB-linked outer membrane protein [Dyadobacter sp. LJ53]|uniref:SusC/RagA family TonB-linked outer membrane protein n=1 Tax=Dyadobacter chenwenxiniae TaxID=2906456 RepID=UPI001F370F87|nr:SusC/RagA family TonB-linked outer membrane protein [Dyadobacter chenwenxiniae]MCF0052425.1 SusC/RagA family TonB-linked outer membrane protein [Dyadobacter chenwenxiniae]
MSRWLFFAGMVLGAMQLIAQDFPIVGMVTSAENGMPLAGVTVQLKGIGYGSVTDSVGRYKILVPDRNSILIFRAVGLVSYEVALLKNQQQLDVQLSVDVSDLKEVVITGYSSSPRTQTTGAYAIVKSKQMENTPFISLDKALQGSVPGLQSAGGSGLPGSFQGVRIRGTGSINAGSEPLYVVNGIPINSGVLARNNAHANTLAGINVNDIEQITVLKDAAAAAAYGSRAANGVIVITLKQGKLGKTSFQFSTEAGFATQAFSSPANRPLHTTEWRELTAEGVRNRYPDQYPDINSATQYVDETFGVDRDVSTNWLKEVTQTGKLQQYHFSAAGGSNQTNFYISTGYLSQTGNVIKTGFKRFTGNMALEHSPAKKITLRTSLILGNTTQFGPDNGGAFSNPVLAAYFLRPSLSSKNAGGGPNISGPDFPAGGLYNPVAIAEMDSRQTSSVKGIFSFAGDLQLFKQLKLTSRIGIDYNTVEEDSYNNPFYGDAVNEKGLSARGYARYFNWIWSNLAAYDLSFSGNKYTIHVSAGYEAQKSKHYFNRTVVHGLPPHSDINVPSAGAVTYAGEGSNSDYAFVSAIGLLDFSIKQKLLLSGSFRRDGSSRFGSLRRHGNFWSVGIAWHVNREDFFKDVPFPDELKLRGSYGFNGNASIGNYDSQAVYEFGKSYNYLGNTGSAPVAPGNNSLTWELSKPLNFGVDMATLGGRLLLTLDWYNRITSNLLIDEPLSATSGFASYKKNAGSMRNRGTEIGLSGSVVRSDPFSWNIFLNIALNKNRILSLPGNQDIVSGVFIRRVGEDLQSFYMRQWAGVNSETGAPTWYTDASRREVTASYNAAKQAITGSASPRAFGSFGSGFRYNGLSLDFQFYYSYGHLVRDAWANFTQSDGYHANFNVVAAELERWQKPGDVTNVPKFVYGGANASNAVSSRFLYRGDYLRLRNVALTYQIPQKLLTDTGLRNVSVYLRGSNVLTWVRDQKLPYDPETNLNSTTNFEVFIPKTFTGGLQLQF